jgi:hypothetical protein
VTEFIIGFALGLAVTTQLTAALVVGVFFGYKAREAAVVVEEVVRAEPVEDTGTDHTSWGPDPPGEDEANRT